MFKLFLLLNPVYVTFFWSLVLNTSKAKGNIPKVFLGKFMITAFLLYLSHLFYYLPAPDIYHYADPFYQLCSLLVYPMYYIYIRLLTVEKRFSIKRHGIYLLPPVILFILYGTGLMFMSKEEHINYLYHFLYSGEKPSGIFLYQSNIYSLLRLVFILQGLLYMWLSFWLVARYKDNIRNHYANTGKNWLNKVHWLNITLSVTIIAGIALSMLGKENFMSDEHKLILPSILFSAMLFAIGWLGNKIPQSVR